MREELIYIQYLRGIAALLVVITHSATHFELVANSFIKHFGEYGVDVFFVISGFIMVYTTLGKKYSTGVFLLRRFERIAPLYYFFTLALIFLALIKPSQFATVDLQVFHTLASFLFIPAVSTSEVFSGSYMPVLYVGWTLNYEMFFYVIFAFSLVFAEKYRLALVGLVLVTLVLVGKMFNISGFFSFCTNLILLEFLLGMILGYLFVHKFIKPSTLLGMIALIAAFGFYYFLHDQDLHRFYYAGFSSFFLVLAALFFHGFYSRKNQILSLLGDASYSIYLSHFFSIGLTSFIRNYFGITDILSIEMITFYIIINLIFSAIVGIMVYKLIEEPINIKLRNKRH